MPHSLIGDVQVKEFDAEGQLTFQGEYSGGVKHGEGVLYLNDGGVIVGTWDAGELSGECRVLLIPARLSHPSRSGTSSLAGKAASAVSAAPSWESGKTVRKPTAHTNMKTRTRNVPPTRRPVSFHALIPRSSHEMTTYIPYQLQKRRQPFPKPLAPANQQRPGLRITRATRYRLGLTWSIYCLPSCDWFSRGATCTARTMWRRAPPDPLLTPSAGDMHRAYYVEARPSGGDGDAPIPSQVAAIVNELPRRDPRTRSLRCDSRPSSRLSSRLSSRPSSRP
eukprot:1190282-Prorocentrum_minimum.AAC.3